MKKVLFLLLSITLISCGGGFAGPGEFKTCDVKIQYHTSSNCDDSPKIAISISFNAIESNPLINDIEDALIGAETGECILVNLVGFKDEGSNENIGNVYLVNDTNKSWLVKDCRTTN